MVTRNRVKYIILFIILILIEVFIAIFVHDKFVRPYIGDVLVVAVIYTAIRAIFPSKNRWLPLGVFTFATVVEYLQYFKIVEILGLEHNKFLSILIGSVFDIKDIVCYGIGCIILWVYQFKIEK